MFKRGPLRERGTPDQGRLQATQRHTEGKPEEIDTSTTSWEVTGQGNGR